MANPNFPRGFQLYSNDGVRCVLNSLPVDGANPTSIGIGDDIILLTDGTAARGNAGASVEQIGVAQGFTDSTGSFLSSIPANTAGTVFYASFFGNKFLVQTSGATVVNSDAVGKLADLVVTADANPITGVSQMELDSASIGTGTQFRILGKDPLSNWGEANVRVVVAASTYVDNVGTPSI